MHLDGDIIGAHVPASHEAFVVVLPVLVAVRAVPLARRVVPLVLEPHGDTVARVAPQLLHQAVVQLLLPLPGEELDYGLPPFEELRPIPPLAVHSVRGRTSHGVARVPSVLCCLHFRKRRFQRERRAYFGHFGPRMTSKPDSNSKFSTSSKNPFEIVVVKAMSTPLTTSLGQPAIRTFDLSHWLSAWMYCTVLSIEF